jgi:hypothetical protein
MNDIVKFMLDGNPFLTGTGIFRGYYDDAMLQIELLEPVKEFPKGMIILISEGEVIDDI